MKAVGHLIIVGRGAFARAFAEGIGPLGLAPVSFDGSLGGCPDVEAVVDALRPECALLLHVGSGRQIQDAVSFCQERGVPMLQASTGASVELPEALNFPFIEAPNLSIPIMKLFGLLARAPKAFSEQAISIRESHQASKKSVPGTAVKLAELLGGDPATIQSVRDPEVQREEFKVPEEHLDGHAVHRVRIEGLGAELEIGTRVLGRETYLHGVKALFELRSRLEKRRYSVSEIVDRWLLPRP